MRRFLGLTLALILGGLALIWLLAGDAQRTPAGGTAADSDLSRAEQLDSVSDLASEALARSEAALTSPDNATSELEVRASDAPAGLRLRVVRREDGSPVPGAEVFWHRPVNNFEHPRYREFLIDRDDRVGFTQLLCTEALRTDETGRVTIPAEAHEYLQVVAIQAPNWGRTTIDPNFHRDETVLTVTRQSDLTVRVLDEDDQPVAGARVGWESEVAGESRAPNAWQWWTTDQDGLARLEHLSPEQLGEPAPLGMSRWIALLEPFEPRVRVRWNWEEPPAQPVLLRMPRHGQVVVEANDSSGAPASDGIDVHLMAADWPWPPGNRGHGRVLLDGRCLFPFVGLDLDLIAAADVEEKFRFATVRERGPRMAGESVTMTIQPSEAGDVLTGRILAGEVIPMHRPWRLSLMIVLANDENCGAFAGTFHLRADGGFTIAVRKEWRQYAGKALLVLTPSDNATGELTAACIELQWPPRAGVTDLGAVACGAELLVAGRVVDAWGQPRAGVRLSACRTVTGEDGQPRASLLDGCDVRTDREGRFRFSGNWPASANRTFVRLGGSMGEEFSGSAFRRGQDDLLITLPVRATVRGTVLTTETLANREIAVQADLDPEDGQPSQEHRGSIQPDGTFSIRNLPAGHYSIGLHSWRPKFDLAGLATLTIGSLPEETPPDLNPLDLRGKLQFCKISARTSDTGPLASAILNLNLQDPYHKGWTYDLPATVAVPIGFGEPATCWVEGYAPAALDWSLPVQEVVLEPLPRIRFRLTGLPASADEYNTVEIRLRQMGATSAEPWSRGFRLTSSMQIQVWVPEPGSYALELNLMLSVPGGASAHARVALGEQQEFLVTVPAGGLTEEVVLEITSAALGAALQSLRKD